MDLAIFRPHDQYWFSKSQISESTFRKAKYTWIIETAISEGHTVNIVPFTPASLSIPELQFFLIDTIRLLRWFLSQRKYYPPSQFKLAFPRKLSRDTTCIVFAYGNLTHYLMDSSFVQRSAFILRFLKRLPLRYLVHLTHYAYNFRFLSTQLSSLNVAKCLGESYLPDSSTYYTSLLPLGPTFYTLPFIPSNRFTCNIPLHQRDPNIISTGTIAVPPSDSNYSSYYGFNSYQPIRENILTFCNSQPYSTIYCISAFLEHKHLTTKKHPARFLLQILSSLLVTPLYTNASASSTSEDIVELYNRYTFAVVGEEACGLPGIGFFEAMACGCVCFATNSAIYTSLGLEPDKHFIVYNGTPEDLVYRHQQVQNNTEHIHYIQSNSLAWISSLSPSSLYRNLLR